MSGRVSWEEAVAWLVSQPQFQPLVRGSYFDTPLSEAAFRYWQSPEWKAIRAWLPKARGNALDVGAGNGIATFALARDGWSVTALEPDPSPTVGSDAIQTLMQGAGLPVEILEGFGEKISLPTETMDLVLARQVLHHARDLNDLCAEMARVLKPGGTLIALRDHVIASPRDLDRFLDIHPLHALYGGEFAYTASAYRSALETAGLQIVRVVRPFESVVNYAPYDREDLRRIIAERARPLIARRLLGGILQSDRALSIVLAILSRFDRTPGRLYSFVCRKRGIVGS
jgi:SAM-dependent methyltransferase